MTLQIRHSLWPWLTAVLVLFTLLRPSTGISCFQCHSRHDGTCPADSGFDKERNAVVDCSDPREASVPGTSCIKIMRHSQDTVGSPGWKEEERRCASKADWGIASGCKIYVTMENIVTEVCYCSTDSCNGAHTIHISTLQTLFMVAIAVAFGKLLL